MIATATIAAAAAAAAAAFVLVVHEDDNEMMMMMMITMMMTDLVLQTISTKHCSHHTRLHSTQRAIACSDSTQVLRTRTLGKD
jgi:hypothetical protein